MDPCSSNVCCSRVDCNHIISKHCSPKSQKVYYDYISFLKKFPYCFSFFSPFFICPTCLSHMYFFRSLSCQFLYQIHSFFLETSKSSVVSCYTIIMTVTKRLIFFPFNSGLIPPLSPLQAITACLCFSFSLFFSVHAFGQLTSFSWPRSSLVHPFGLLGSPLMVVLLLLCQSTFGLL